MSAKLNFKSDILPFLIATIGEFIALHFWLYYMDLDQFLLANILLWIGFGIERGSVALWIKKVYRPKEGITGSSVPLWKQLLGWGFITLTEIIIWIIWLWAIQQWGLITGTVILYVLMLIEHSAEMGLVKQKSLWIYVKVFNTHLFTLMETLGALGWIYFHQQGQDEWAIVCLIVGLSIEHIIQGSALKPDEERVYM